MKKLKKLTLNKKVVSILGGNDMNLVKGGTGYGYTFINCSANDTCTIFKTCPDTCAYTCADTCAYTCAKTCAETCLHCDTVQTCPIPLATTLGYTYDFSCKYIC